MRQAGKHWPPGQIELAVAMWQASSTLAEIADAVSGEVTLNDGTTVNWPPRTAGAVQTAISRAGYRSPTHGRKMDRGPRARRTCLTCLKPFWSWGSGNRMCDRCRQGGGEGFDARWTYAC